MTPLALDFDAVLGDTGPLWRAWLDDLARRSRVELAGFPASRGEAAAWLDGQVGNWRDLLERFAEEHAPVHLRPDARASAALRRLAAAGETLGAWTDAPEPLARVAAAHLGAARRLDALECGAGARERLLARLGPDARPIASLDELLASAA